MASMMTDTSLDPDELIHPCYKRLMMGDALAVLLVILINVRASIESEGLY